MEWLRAARSLLNPAPGSVTTDSIPFNVELWPKPKDRSSADRVRVQVLEALTTLQSAL